MVQSMDGHRLPYTKLVGHSLPGTIAESDWLGPW